MMNEKTKAVVKKWTTIFWKLGVAQMLNAIKIKLNGKTIGR